MINLFILVLISQFEEYHVHQDHPLHTYKDYLDKFVKTWGIYTYQHDGIKIESSKLKKFFCKLPKPIGLIKFIENIINYSIKGFGKNEETEVLFKEIMLMNMKM